MKRHEDEVMAILHATFLKEAMGVNTHSLSPEQLNALDRDIEKSRKVLANTKPGRKKKA